MKIFVYRATWLFSGVSTNNAFGCPPGFSSNLSLMSRWKGDADTAINQLRVPRH